MVWWWLVWTASVVDELYQLMPALQINLQLLSMKGELSVNPTFDSFGIHRPSLHSRNPLVIFDGHRLHCNQLSIPWHYKAIINCTHIPSLGVLMVLCSDWKLYIFNKNLELIAKLSDWQSKYSVGFEYIESLNLFILIGVIEIELLRVRVHTNVRQTKFLSSVKFNIERLEMKAVEEKNRLTWNKGYGYDLKEGLLYVWSSQNIHFYGLPKLDLRSSIQRLVKKETAITCVHFNRSYKYTVTGLINGNVKVWRVPLIMVSASEYTMIHNCVYHGKAVDKIVPAADERIIITSAEDLTLCMWSLETFELLRVYNFEGEYTSLFLVDFKHAFAVHNGELGDLVFGKTMQFILEVDSPITFVDKAESVKGGNRSFQFTLESNVGFQIKGSDLGAKDLNKIDIAYFYPPMKAQSIIQVAASPYDPQLYYMLVETGQLYSLRLDGNSSRIEESYSLQHTLDCQAHPLNQLPTQISFMNIGGIQYDSQIIEGPSMSSEKQNLQLITVGCNRGTIVVLQLSKIDRIRSRFTYHREAIICMELIHKDQTSKVLVSLCKQDYLRFTLLQNDRANCFLTLFCDNCLVSFKALKHQLALCFRKGIFQLAQAEIEEETLTLAQNADAVDHEGQILSLDYEPERNLILTSGSDNKLKIWSTLKELMFEIKLDEGLKYGVWSNNMQIFVAHRNKMLYLRHVNYDFNEYEESPNLLFVDIKTYFSNTKKELRLSKDHFSARKKALSQIKPSLKGTHTTNFRQPQIVNKSLIDEPIPRKTGKSLRKKTTKKKKLSGVEALLRDEEERRKKETQEQHLKATKKHIEEMERMRKASKMAILPGVGPRQDKFEEFISAKLVSKKMLTRRDITLNRIIMKNLIREQFTQQEDDLSQIKLDI